MQTGVSLRDLNVRAVTYIADYRNEFVSLLSRYRLYYVSSNKNQGLSNFLGEERKLTFANVLLVKVK